MRYLLLLCLLFCGSNIFAQSSMTTGNPAQPNTIANAPQRDTNSSKSNTSKWKNENARITYEKLNTARIYKPDTALHAFQRNPFTEPWARDMGNLGSPINNLFFTPEDRVGPTFGYHVFDPYRFNVDSLNFYNTNRPYSVFNYQLGSKLEQSAGIMHTQNIKPNWNFAVEYRRITSPGYYKTSRNNDDNAYLTTNYKSLNKHYVLYAAMVYNKNQHDENGGIRSDTDLVNTLYSDRATIYTPYGNDAYSTTRSTVSNVQREFTLLLQHSYIWGRTDTAYNADSTQYTYQLHPRFSITHKMEISTEKHTYKDLAPDSTRYTTLFNAQFISNGTGYYQALEDSVYTLQKWFWIDNKVTLNGYLGKDDRQLKFSAGIGNRYDQFSSGPVVTSIIAGTTAQEKTSIISNYLVGELRKEALTPNAWEYGANAKFYITGADAGNLSFNALLGKQLRNNAGGFVLGFQQQINSAPYSYTNYDNSYAKINTSFSDESVTTLYATFESPKLRLSGGVRNYVVANYIYINEAELPAQYTVPFNVTQVWGRKVFKIGNFYIDNELAFQQIPTNAPVNIPALMGKHQFSYESSLFKQKLKVVTGVQARYNTSYDPAGYDALLNKFYYQHSRNISNTPELAVFFNFRIKRFRAFVMGDNLQQLFSKNTILYTGTPYTDGASGLNYSPVYAAQDAMIRLGFSWVLIN